MKFRLILTKGGEVNYKGTKGERMLLKKNLSNKYNNKRTLYKTKPMKEKPQYIT